MLLICAFAFSAYAGAATAEREDREFYRCTRVVDGDTLIVKIEGEKTEIGLLGVEAPVGGAGVSSSLHDLRLNVGLRFIIAEEAYRFTKERAERKKVGIEYDMVKWRVSPATGQATPLAYVFLKDGTMLNTELIRLGLALANTREVFKYSDAFEEAEREAVLNKRGLWSTPAKKKKKP